MKVVIIPIKVYCDGSCRPNPGPAYIGVYCEDPLIEIAKRVDGYTNNAAECLAVIAGLEECQRLGLNDVEIMTDSQTALGWTVGGWKWKSSTAFDYVDDIRYLLKKVDARLVWIPSKDNLADKLSKRVRLRGIDKELINLKAGKNSFSKLSKTEVIEKVGEAWTAITKRLEKEKYQLSAARGHLRGLPLETAIRKVEATRAQGREINFRRKMRYNEE